MDPVHLIPQLVLRRRYGLEGDELWRECLVVAGCRDMHHAFDNGFLLVPVDALSDDLRAFAAELDPPYSFADDFRFRAG